MSQRLSVVLKDGLSAEQVEAVAAAIRAVDGVAEVSYVETAGSGDDGGLESAQGEGSGWPP